MSGGLGAHFAVSNNGTLVYKAGTGGAPYLHWFWRAGVGGSGKGRNGRCVGGGRDSMPIWTPDGEYVLITSARTYSLDRATRC